MKMKSNFTVPLFCVIITVLILMGAMPAQVQADEKVIKLRYSNLFPPAHPMAVLSGTGAKR